MGLWRADATTASWAFFVCTLLLGSLEATTTAALDAGRQEKFATQQRRNKFIVDRAVHRTTRAEVRCLVGPSVGSQRVTSLLLAISHLASSEQLHPACLG